MGTAPAGADSLVVHGRAVSVVGEDTRRLVIAATDDGGVVRFTHWAPNGVSRFVATVTCLAFDGDMVNLTGEVIRGQTAAGVVLDGRAVGFTIGVEEPQSFSLPQLAAELPPCAGSGRPQVPVTSGGFRVI